MKAYVLFALLSAPMGEEETKSDVLKLKCKANGGV